MKNHRIVWTSKATGSDETVFVGSLTDARRSARRMVGEAVVFDGEEIGTVENAYVADENGNPIR